MARRAWIHPREFDSIIKSKNFIRSTIVNSSTLHGRPANFLRVGSKLYVSYADKTASKMAGFSIYDVNTNSLADIETELSKLFVFDIISIEIYPDLGIWLATNEGLINVDNSSISGGKLKTDFLLRGKLIHSLCTDNEFIYFIAEGSFYILDPLTNILEKNDIKEDISGQTITSIFFDEANDKIIVLVDTESTRIPSILVYKKGETEPATFSDGDYPQCGYMTPYGHLCIGGSFGISILKSKDFSTISPGCISSISGQVLSIARVKAGYHELVFFSFREKLFVSYYVTQIQMMIEIYRYSVSVEDVQNQIPPYLNTAFPIEISSHIQDYILELKYSDGFLYFCTPNGIFEVNIDHLLKEVSEFTSNSYL